MGFFELVKLFFSEDEEIVIPINDEEDTEYSCGSGIEIEEVEFTQHFECMLSEEGSNIQQLLELVDNLPESPNGNPPEFVLERKAII